MAVASRKEIKCIEPSRRKAQHISEAVTTTKTVEPVHIRSIDEKKIKSKSLKLRELCAVQCSAVCVYEHGERSRANDETRRVHEWNILLREKAKHFHHFCCCCSCAFVIYWVSLRLFRFLDTIKATGNNDAALNNSLKSHWNLHMKRFFCCHRHHCRSSFVVATLFLWWHQTICFVLHLLAASQKRNPIMEWHQDSREQKQKIAAIQHDGIRFFFAICGRSAASVEEADDLEELLRRQKKIGLFVWWHRHPRLSCQSIWPRQYSVGFCYFSSSTRFSLPLSLSSLCWQNLTKYSAHSKNRPILYIIALYAFL